MKTKRLFIAITLVVVIIGLLLIGCTKQTEAPVPQKTKSIVTNVSSEAAHNLINASKGDPDFVILDVRTAIEYIAMHIDQAVNVEFLRINIGSSSTSDPVSGKFEKDIGTKDKNKTYLVYSKAGLLSAAAAGIMEKLGFTKLYNMQGGISQWETDGFPVVRY